MKAIKSASGVIIPESKIAKIMPIPGAHLKSRVFVAGTIETTCTAGPNIIGHYEDFYETTSELTERLGWLTVN